MGVPEAVLAVPLRRALLLLLALGAGLAALSAGWRCGSAGASTLPIGALADRAAALGRGEAVAPLLTPVREVNRVAAELEAASASLGEREAALRASEARLRAILGTVPVGVVIAEAPSGRIVERQQAGRAHLRPPRPAFGGRGGHRAWLSHHPDGRQVAPEEYPLSRVVRDGEERAELEVLYQRGDESEAWVRLIAAPIRDEEGRITGGVVACLDVDREKRAEAALRRLNEELEERVAERTAERDRMWRLSTDLMMVARFDGTVAAVNPAWTAVLGWRQDELLGARFVDLVHPHDAASTLAETSRLAEGRTTRGFENRYRHKDGSHRWLSWTAVPDEGLIHAVARDVTAEKAAQAELAEAQEQLRQAQKMEAVGQLTGGVAHDFNNLLQVIRRQHRPGAPAPGRWRRAGAPLPPQRRRGDQARRRAHRPAARLLAPADARPEAGGRRTRWCPACRTCCGARWARRSGSRRRWRAELWQTCADPNQLENAILNLAVNARDAMPGDGGRLTVETANAYLDERYARENQEVLEGQYVLIAVSDTGCGMSPEVASRAFEPFFTTKDVGQGTGLGLSQVYGFVKQSGGHVKIYSEPGEGTTVKVYLPRLRDGADDGAAADGAGPRRSTKRTGGACRFRTGRWRAKWCSWSRMTRASGASRRKC